MLSEQRVPGGMEPVHGVFARVGAIALNAVVAADVHLGEHVAVFGQGVIGLLAGQLARRNGARVVVVDALARRRDLGLRLGAAAAVPADAAGGAGAVVRALAGDAGADVAVELSGSYQALHEAVRCVGTDGRVVAAGFYQGDGVGLRLGEEFHHNRVHLVSSHIGGTPPALGARWGRARLVSVFMAEIASGAVQVAPLVSHVVAAQEVASAFRVLDETPGEALQVVLRFPAAPA